MAELAEARAELAAARSEMAASSAALAAAPPLPRPPPAAAVLEAITNNDDNIEFLPYDTERRALVASFESLPGNANRRALVRMSVEGAAEAAAKRVHLDSSLAELVERWRRQNKEAVRRRARRKEFIARMRSNKGVGPSGHSSGQ
ncbi:hypothetical protein QYE76_043911 [Lolium multiflorum]|uniref:Uncharacterized protein n=1 Tax=Lolium multiflorum TaxID=4521 RepID=A0AAD8TJZ6_LOLMU|nr:hypothetical protein QYE76_043911 [Lolium multiflorum]